VTKLVIVDSHRPRAGLSGAKNSGNSLSDTPILDDTILIENNLIQDRGHHLDLIKRYPQIPILDGEGYMVFPGLVNGHTHCAMGFFRGLGHGVAQMIQKLFFPVENCLDQSMIEGLSLGYILSGLRRGVTFFADHYYFVGGVARALDRLGLRGAVGETVADCGGAHPSYESFVRAQDHVSHWPHSPRIRPVAAPHATDTVTPGLLAQVGEWAKREKLPIHMHLAQTSLEWEAAKVHGLTPVGIAHRAKLLTDRTLVVHLLHRSDEDLKILKDTSTSVGVCPASQIIYEKLTDLKTLAEHKIPLVIGTDCAASDDHSDVLDELRTFALLAKDRLCDPPFYAPENLLSMATENPYHIFTPDLKIGKIAPGFLADLVFASIDVSLLPLHQPLTNLIYSSGSKNVKHVLVDGNWVLWNGQPVNMSLPSLTEEYQHALGLIYQRTGPVLSKAGIH
jgi:5-methylthioadenosine/S-adenosylhomocysteine deaminase